MEYIPNKQILQKHTKIKCAGGIIYDRNNNKLCIVKGPSKWSLPKGHSEYGEKFHETAMREICEETSINISINDWTRHIKISDCIYYFICIDNGMSLELCSVDKAEIQEILWCDKKEIEKLNCNKQLEYFIRNWDMMMDIFYNSYKMRSLYSIDSNGKITNTKKKHNMQ
jgi:8-oxo-dGTP pyrophosphatase MutT (NUDIX family)